MKYNIGNYLQADDGNFIAVEMVDNHYLADHGICQMTAKGLVALDNNRIKVIPIVLTDKWLIWFEFTATTKQLFKKGEFLIYNIKDSNFFDLYYKGHLIGTYQYIHELQDICSSITRNELIFNDSL